MLRCHDLSRYGQGQVKSNPVVGAVITYNEQIIGEGFHEYFGGPHAEINAIASVSPENKPLLTKSTIHVSLEPCSTIGKTPACTDAIQAIPFSRVTYSVTDPNPAVNGSGIRRLQNAGVATELVAIDRNKAAIKPFRIQQIKKRPFIILKFAQSADGFISKKDERTNISNVLTKRLVHKWRSECDAILIGRKTAEIDNPLLTNRYFHGASPIRIIIDPNNQVRPTLSLMTDESPTWVVNESMIKNEGNKKYIKIDIRNGLLPMLQYLLQENIGTLFVEGGRHTLDQFIHQKLWDKAYVITNEKYINGGLAAPQIKGAVTSTYRLRNDFIHEITPMG